MSHTPESQHWYDRDGKPVFTVKSKDGRDIAPDIRHARKLGLVPGFNAISKVLSSPALERYKQEQAILAALTLTRTPGEDDKSFLARVREDSAAHAKQRAEEGTAVHKAIEQHIRGQAFDKKWAEHVLCVMEKLDGIPRPFVGDFKTKPTLTKKDGSLLKDEDLFFDEHIMQLCAYVAGLREQFKRPNEKPVFTKDGFVMEKTFASHLGYGGRVDIQGGFQGDGPLPLMTLASIFIGVMDKKVRVKLWSLEESDRGWKMFEHALAVWKLRNRYESGWVMCTPSIHLPNMNATTLSSPALTVDGHLGISSERRK